MSASAGVGADDAPSDVDLLAVALLGAARKIQAGRTALASLPDDPERFPVACWFRDRLIGQMHRHVLSGEHMRLPCSSSRQRGFRADGSNLPWVLHRLQQNPAHFAQWLAHLQDVLPEFRSFSTVFREEEHHRYLTARATEDVALPSWLLSDGTLRLLALTLLAYVEDLSGSYLIEEPENGIHPKAMESVFQSLSSVYNAQILCATHSPVLISLASPAQLLCFAKTPDGRTDVIQGDQHPVLRDWQRTIDLETLFASGLLTRHQSLGIQPLQLDTQSPLVHPRHDPGCWKDGPELLAIEHQFYRHGLLALDWEGCNSKRSADETRCTDPAFAELKTTLQPWFPPEGSS